MQIHRQDALDTRMGQFQEALRIVEEAGCDFPEFGVGVGDPEQWESVFERLRATLGGTDLVPECFSSFVPSDIALRGDGLFSVQGERG